MLFEKCDRPLPCNFGCFGVVCGLGVREKSMRCTGIDKDPVVAVILLQRGLKGFQLGKLNLWILLGIMTLDRNRYGGRDIDGIHFSIGKCRCLKIAVKRHHRADLFWIGSRKHKRTSAADAESGNSYAVGLSEALF